MNVSRYTEIVLENVIRGSKNLPGTLKFARMLFPGYQRVAVHRNIPQKRAQNVEKHPGTVKTALQTMIVSWESTCRGTLK